MIDIRKAYVGDQVSDPINQIVVCIDEFVECEFDQDDCWVADVCNDQIIGEIGRAWIKWEEDRENDDGDKEAWCGCDIEVTLDWIETRFADPKRKALKDVIFVVWCFQGVDVRVNRVSIERKHKDRGKEVAFVALHWKNEEIVS